MKLKPFFLLSILSLSGCSLFNNAVINVPESERDNVSYVTGYQIAQQTYQGRVDRNYKVDDFTRGVKDWYQGYIKDSLETMRQKLFNKLLDNDVYAYRNGVVFAGDLQNNLSHFGKNCWEKLDKLSVTQGIYDAMKDLQQQRDGLPEAFLEKGTQELLVRCQVK